jgi:hypothetical protein
VRGPIVRLSERGGPVPFTIHNDAEIEAVVEAFTIVLSNPQGGALTSPSSASFLIVDEDGDMRVAFDELTYTRSESHATLTIPVWRAGPVVDPTTVPYTVGPGPGAPATENDDYTVTSQNPLIFNPGERVKAITLSIVNDKISEPEETVELTLQSPTNAGLATPSTKLVTIQDNEENVPSRFHHPRNKWKYNKATTASGSSTSSPPTRAARAWWPPRWPSDATW